MKQTQAEKMSTDLDRFMWIYGDDKCKRYADKVEYRGVTDIERSTAQAKRVIENSKLQLAVVTSGALASYKAFEVVCIVDQEGAAV
jgi:ABC-type Fe3+ transport system substrate-binding protein